MVSVIRKKDAQQLAKARQLRRESLAEKTITVGGTDLLMFLRALDSAGQHEAYTDYANATRNLAEMRPSPLTSEIFAAKKRLHEILDNALEAEAPPTPPATSGGGGESK